MHVDDNLGRCYTMCLSRLTNRAIREQLEHQGKPMTEYVRMSYKDVASAFGLSGPDSARIKVRRRGWKVTPGNHPRASAMVDVPQIEIDERSKIDRPKRSPITPPDAEPEAVAKLVTLVAELHAANASVNAALLDATARAARAEGALDELRRRGWLGRWLS